MSERQQSGGAPSRGRGGSRGRGSSSYRGRGSSGRGRNSNTTRGGRGDASTSRRGNSSAYGRNGFGSAPPAPPSTVARSKPSKEMRKQRRRDEQKRAVNKKAQMETDYFWECVKNVNTAQAKQKSKREVFGVEVRMEGIDFDKYQHIKVECSNKEIKPLESFVEVFSLIGDKLAQNIKDMKYQTPTPVQKFSIPVGLSGQDIMACAQTGSGKTAAFLVPSIANLVAMGNWKGPNPAEGIVKPLVVVLAPTRELASQIYLEAEKLSFRFNDIAAVNVYGGVPAKPQLLELAKTRLKKLLVIGTPGRVTDFIDRDIIRLCEVKQLVLDEADRMLDMGFEPQVRKIVELRDMPSSKERTTFMFSATFPSPIQRLATDFLKPNYCYIAVGRVGRTTSSIEQRMVYAENDRRKKLHLLAEQLKLVEGKTLVFVGMKRSASRIKKQLSRDYNITSVELHGDRSQAQRENALDAFRSGKVRVLVATNVASRGLDISDVAHVINMDLPLTSADFQDYIHRIGRTGRAGNRGIATSFYTPGFDKLGNGKIAKDLLKLLKEADQEIPKWFLDLPEVGGVGGAGNSKRQSGRKPQADARKASSTSKRPSNNSNFAGRKKQATKQSRNATSTK